jgi:hypothetical protein
VARENLEFDTESTYIEDLPRRTSVDPQGIIQSVVEQGPVFSKFLPQDLLGLGLIEVGWRRAGGLPLLLQSHHGGIWGGKAGARRRRLTIVRWLRRHHAIVFLHHQDPAAGSGAGAGQFSH